jgi:hypothetical protein
MAVVRERWLSARAVSLHAAVLVFVPGCALAAWWQVSRAQSGNQLSYLYSVMWPAFAILGVCFWWMLIHTDFDSVGLRGMRRQAERAEQAEQTEQSRQQPADTAASTAPFEPRSPLVPGSEEDPELAAYNARLAELAAKGPNTWRNSGSITARRAQ